MRNKNDICIKYYQIATMLTLTNEEVGIAIRNMIIEEDKEKLRYENLSESMKEILKKEENEYIKQKNEISNNRKIIFETAFSSVSGQAKNSKREFERLKERQQKKAEQEKNKNNENNEDFLHKKYEEYFESLGNNEYVALSFEEWKKAQKNAINLFD